MEGPARAVCLYSGPGGFSNCCGGFHNTGGRPDSRFLYRRFQPAQRRDEMEDRARGIGRVGNAVVVPGAVLDSADFDGGRGAIRRPPRGGRKENIHSTRLMPRDGGQPGAGR